MFLSNTVVPVFIFSILLNFMYLYSADDTTPPAPTTPPASTTPPCIEFNMACDECMKSPCHVNLDGPCIPDTDNQSYACVECNKDNLAYYTKDLCDKGCTGDKSCACSGMCFSCATQDEISSFTCLQPPTLMADDSCTTLISYQPPTGTSPPTGASSPTGASPPTVSSATSTATASGPGSSASASSTVTQ